MADFIGRASFVDATVRDVLDGHLVVNALGATMKIPAPPGEFRESQKVVMVVRPEMVEVDQPEGHLEGVVRRANYLGDVVEYDVEVGGQLLALVEKDPRRTTIHPEGDTRSGCIS